MFLSPDWMNIKLLTLQLRIYKKKRIGFWFGKRLSIMHCKQMHSCLITPWLNTSGGHIFSFRIVFSFIHLLTSFPAQADKKKKKHSHSVMQPPPCFTLVMWADLVF